MVSPEMLAVTPLLTVKTRVVWLPSTATRLALVLLIVRFLSIVNVPNTRVMVPVTEKVMVSPGLALMMAARRVHVAPHEPPESDNELMTRDVARAGSG